MKIGFQNVNASINYSAGINVQARMWARGLAKLGHETVLINYWEKIDYNSFDYIILLGVSKQLIDYHRLYRRFKHPKIVCAPIIDYNGPFWKFKVRSRFFGSLRLKVNKPLHDLYKISKDFDLFLVRSQYEKKFIVDGLGVDGEKVYIIPISMRLDDIPQYNMSKKENFCLHMSRLADPGKNVKNLILAAKKYGFTLKIGGTLNGEEQVKWLNKLIGDAPNISYLGWLTEGQLRDVYSKAKVFALPSFVEGVGMVALEAAVYGAEIVLTNIGAPKEYYNGRAVLVNPYDVDSIGAGVIEAMNSKQAQPELRDYILNNYSLGINMKQLENVLLNYLK